MTDTADQPETPRRRDRLPKFEPGPLPPALERGRGMMHQMARAHRAAEQVDDEWEITHVETLITFRDQIANIRQMLLDEAFGSAIEECERLMAVMDNALKAARQVQND